MVLAADVKQVAGRVGLLFGSRFGASAGDTRARLRRWAGLVLLAAAILGLLWSPFLTGMHGLEGMRQILFDGPKAFPGRGQAMHPLAAILFALCLPGAAFA